MSQSEEKFRIKGTIIDVHDYIREDNGQCENGVVLRIEVEGHPDVFMEMFVEVFDPSEDVMKRVIDNHIESSKYNLALAVERKRRGDLVGKLGHLKNMTVIKEDCCFDCVKRQVGLLPPEEPKKPTFVEEIAPNHQVQEI